LLGSRITRGITVLVHSFLIRLFAAPRPLSLDASKVCQNCGTITQTLMHHVLSKL